MGLVDRIVRAAIAVIIVGLYSMGRIQGPWGLGLVGLSIILLLTSSIGFCPLYLPLGLSTIRKKLSGKANR